ncbi:GNAT family N-acetyltransferase [Frankia sp. R82]|uniref:GNAT family N-acetyltransferase n=1 Tax=Frankia sp. R82 TaxID=2950553 RepID=UPI0035AB78F6
MLRGVTVLLRPELVDGEVSVRAGREDEVEALLAILAEPSVTAWWGTPPAVENLRRDLLADRDPVTDADPVLLVVTVAGVVAGGIQYDEDNDPQYRQASIDVFLGSAFQGRGLGTRAVTLVARFLFEDRGHHRVTIDPAAANAPAIRSYTKVGFRPVGIMREYELGPDGVRRDGLLMDLLRTDLAGGRHIGR